MRAPTEGDSAGRFDIKPRQVPHNLDAEQALLGSILVDNRALEAVSETVQAGHFFDPLHQDVFKAIAAAIGAGKLATPLSLKTEFERYPAINPNLTVPQYLGTLAANATTIINARDYAKLIRNLATRRALILVGEDLIAEAYEAGLHVEPDEQVAEAEKRLSELVARPDDERAVDWGAAAFAAVDYANDAYQRDGALAGLSCGLIDLDAKLGGLAKGDLVIVAGRPSMGKTALVTGMAWATASQGQPVDFYSLEMSQSQIAMRILAGEIGVSSEKLRRGMTTEEELRRLVMRATETAKHPLHIDDRGGLTIGQLVARARRAARRHGTELIVVDYLQLMAGTKGNRDGRVREVAEITSGLKALAKELDIPIIALSQLSRATESREEKRPQLSDLRESGAIEQDADVVMFVYREAYYVERRKPDPGDMEKTIEWMREMERAHGKAEVIIGKQRHGPTGIVQLAFESEFARFSDLARDARGP